MKSNFEQAKKKIMNMNWKNNGIDKPSYIILVTEFIRRGNIFLDFNSKDDNRRAVFNAAEVINFDTPAHIKEECNALVNSNVGWVTEYLCTFYLEWAYVVDKKTPVALKFHDLYDPIIKLFERGGRISYHHNELVCGKHGWPRNSGVMTRGIQPQDIRDEVLDALDDEQ
ncbi:MULTISPECIES: hypothetical protein [unclassified Paenibacillus]|uniref:hypothetical protein n=1 Tax=unclassified Paenibacillus TaxID=185978 RepID=UPI0003E20733|nr:MULTISPECIES: hypothetical protein [unclassified Paenibacillus]ETT30261.1 hypothetical protein C162_33668 [Paenibacillus sp. FSL R7-269]OMF94222.1 hypothetical protein BK147_16905 [Paenibacillus sp. FSL R7-0337]